MSKKTTKKTAKTADKVWWVYEYVAFGNRFLKVRNTRESAKASRKNSAALIGFKCGPVERIVVKGANP